MREHESAKLFTLRITMGVNKYVVKKVYFSMHQNGAAPYAQTVGEVKDCLNKVGPMVALNNTVFNIDRVDFIEVSGYRGP